MAASPTGSVYWQGADGNIYLKAQTAGGPWSTSNIGPASNFSLTPSGLSEDGANIQANQIADPNPPQANGGGNTSSSSSNVNPVAQSYYNNIISQLQSALGTTRGEQGTVVSNITNAANNQENQLNQQESNAETGYNTQKAENGSSRATNIDQINQGSNQLYNSLMGILGAAGAGVSSVARYTAPQAVSQNASTQRSGADTTYNNNATAINSDETQTKQQYQNDLTDLNTQKNTDIGQALESLLNTEAGINQQITQAQTDANLYSGENFTPAQQAGPTQAVNNIESQLGQIFQQYSTPTFNVSPVTASTPNLTSYNVDPTTVAAQNSSPGTESAFLPYLASLNPNNNPKQQNNILTGGASAPTATAATAGAAA